MISQKVLEVLEQVSPLINSPIHGIKHWVTVERNGHYLANFNGADKAVLSYFAYFHDCMRENEGRDKGHGPRAAVFAMKHRDIIPLNDVQFKQLTDACKGHTDGTRPECITINTCWDADRLDLTRVRILPDSNYLFNTEAKRIVDTYDYPSLIRFWTLTEYGFFKKDKTKHTCHADVSKFYDVGVLIDFYHKLKQDYFDKFLKYLYKRERSNGKSINQYAVKFYNTYSEVKTYILYKSQYDYWLENQDKLNKYTSDLFLPLSPECSDLERLRLHNPDGYSRFIKTHAGRYTLRHCPSRHNETGELISSLDIPIWAKFNTWSIIASSVNASSSPNPSLLHSKICITENGLDYAHFSVRDFVLDNDINLSVFKTDNQLPFEAPVYLMQINIFNPKSSVPCVYHFDAFGMLDLNKFSLSVSAIYCGDYVINDLFYEDAVHPLKYYEAHKAADSVVPKLFKYDETYPSTPEEALDLNCREIFESSAGSYNNIQLSASANKSNKYLFLQALLSITAILVLVYFLIGYVS